MHLYCTKAISLLTATALQPVSLQYIYIACICPDSHRTAQCNRSTFRNRSMTSISSNMWMFTLLLPKMDIREQMKLSVCCTDINSLYSNGCASGTVPWMKKRASKSALQWMFDNYFSHLLYISHFCEKKLLVNDLKIWWIEVTNIFWSVLGRLKTMCPCHMSFEYVRNVRP